MKIPDINLLIYAVNRDTPHHGKAREWLETALSSRDTVGFAWIVLLGFLRIVTNDRIMPKPLSLDTASGLIDEWLDLPVSQIISPKERHWEIVKELLRPLGVAGNLTSDAHLAALTIEHGGRLYSTDNDFSRFRLLRWTNPLQT